MRAIDRLISILEVFLTHPRCTLTEIARYADLSEPTAFRYVGTLTKHGWLVAEPSGYRLGIPIFQLGGRAVAELNVSDVVIPYLEELRNEFKETVNFAVHEGDRIVIVEAVESRNAIKRGASIGESDIWHSSALGKAILSQLEKSEITKLLGTGPLERFTPNTATTTSALIRKLKYARRLGYAIDDEESEVGLSCVATVVRDRSGGAHYAISISGPTTRMGQIGLDVIGKRLADVARDVSWHLGHFGHAN